MSHYTYEIIGGVLIFLSSLVSEAFPKKLRIALWVVFALLAVGYTTAGVHLDKEAAATAEGARAKTEKETNELKTEVQGLDTNTSNLISTIAGMFQMVASLNADLATLRRDTEAAKEHHDPRLINDLEHQAQAAQQQVDTISHELLAITMAPQVAQQLLDWEKGAKYRQEELHAREWEEHLQWGEKHPNTPEEPRLAEWDVIYQQAQDDSIDQLKKTIATADFIRQELLRRIPPQQLNADDKKWEQEFSQAKNKPESLLRWAAARYLEELARRVPPPPPPPK